MADDPELDADDRALIDQLRTLPPEGNEPDWNALEAAIRAEVGDQAPRPWWRNWKWIVPIWALATTAAVALLVLHRKAPVEKTALPERHHQVMPAPTEAAHSLWLDGEALDLDDVDDQALDALDSEARAAMRPSDDATGGLLPVHDYGWIDTLDDDAMNRAETWLQRKRS